MRVPERQSQLRAISGRNETGEESGPGDGRPENSVVGVWGLGRPWKTLGAETVDGLRNGRKVGRLWVGEPGRQGAVREERSAPAGLGRVRAEGSRR